MLVLDKDAIDRLNRIDEAMTLATLPAFKPVVEGEMIATVKIIPFAVAATARDQAVAEAGKGEAGHPRRALQGAQDRHRVDLAARPFSESGREDAQDHRRRALRLPARPSSPSAACRMSTPALARAIDEVLKAGAELVIVFGASAIADRRDVIPAAVEAIGGEIEHFGMPVDPGNLMLIGRLRGQAVIGAPGCARSPKENGFDWVLMRLLAGLPVSRADITGMGVGGLLMEIVTRPQPRTEPAPEKGRRIAAVVLAAGRSTRMGAINKLIAEIGGKPLVRIAAEQALASRAKPVIVVTGHERERVEAALAGLPVRFVHNPDYAEGLGTSLKTGIAAVPADADGAIVCLGDMPQVDSQLIDKLIAAFDPERGALVVVPTFDGRRGNPVVWSRRFFHDLMSIARRHRRPPPDRQLCRGGRRSAGRRRGGAHRRGHARVVFRRQGRNRTRLRLRIVDRHRDSALI